MLIYQGYWMTSGVDKHNVGPNVTGGWELSNSVLLMRLQL